MSDLNQLWLAPICHEDGDGRLWREDDVWGDDCGCGIEQHSAVRYVLASDYDACASRLHEVAEVCAIAEQERDALRAQIEAMRELLRKVAPHFAAPPGLGRLHADIDAALQAKP